MAVSKYTYGKKMNIIYPDLLLKARTLVERSAGAGTAFGLSAQ